MPSSTDMRLKILLDREQRKPLIIMTDVEDKVSDTSATAKTSAESVSEARTAVVSAMSPLSSYTVSSKQGLRVDPISGNLQTHNGLDMQAAYGSPIMSGLSGEVIYSGWNGSAGKQVQVKNDDGTIAVYSHCQNVYPGVGQRVVQGETIGAVGSTGRSTGAHLDLKIKDISGKYLNVDEWLTGKHIVSYDPTVVAANSLQTAIIQQSQQVTTDPPASVSNILAIRGILQDYLIPQQVDYRLVKTFNKMAYLYMFGEHPSIAQFTVTFADGTLYLDGGNDTPQQADFDKIDVLKMLQDRTFIYSQSANNAKISRMVGFAFNRLFLRGYVLGINAAGSISTPGIVMASMNVVVYDYEELPIESDASQQSTSLFANSSAIPASFQLQTIGNMPGQVDQNILSFNLSRTYGAES